MIRHLSSEWLRTKHTSVRWLTFCMPVVFALCASAYLAAVPEATGKFAFEGFFTIWTVFIIPAGTGILAGFIVHEEELAGNFNSLLGNGISRTKLYLGKFLLLFFCLAACTFIAVSLLCIGMNIAIPDQTDVSLFLAAGVLVVIGALPLLALHLWLSFAWGMGTSVAVSIGGLLMAALLGLTRLGSKVWPFVPWTWPVKLGMLPGVYFLKESGAVPAEEIFSGAAHTVVLGMSAAVIALVIFLIGGIMWFHRWEGRRGCE